MDQPRNSGDAVSAGQKAERERMLGRALLYRKLADELVEWQSKAGNSVGEESAENAPLIWKLHQICHALYHKSMTAEASLTSANKLLTDNGLRALEPGEVAALARLMSEPAFMPLAPYDGNGPAEIW